MTNSFGPEPVNLSDPTISPHRLQELAQTHPAQWDEILAHPNVYPGLADWIRNRQAEQAAAGVEAAADEPVYEADRETTDQAAQADDTALTTPADEPTQVLFATDTTETTDEAESADGAELTEAVQPADTQPTWSLTPEQEAPQSEPPHQRLPPTQQSAPAWGGPSGQPYVQQNQPGQQPPLGTPQGQWGYPGSGYPGFAQQQHGQQPFMSGRVQQQSAVNFSAPATWALFVSGGAAFLSLFSFFFAPSPTMHYGSHLGAGGWLVLLLLLGTIVLSILQLVKPSRWMRFAFLAVSLGAGFMMFGRAMTFFWFFLVRDTGFSVVWMMAMATILLAASLVYLAQRHEDSPRPATPARSQQGYQAAPQRHFGGHPGQQNTPGYGKYPGYESQPGHYPNDPQQGSGPYGPKL